MFTLAKRLLWYIFYGTMKQETFTPFKCCKCKRVAFERYLFLNREDKVADNPSCEKHTEEIREQTLKILYHIHGDKARQKCWRQRWVNVPPHDPSPERLKILLD